MYIKFSDRVISLWIHGVIYFSISFLSRLLRALMSHELVTKGYTEYTWRDNFTRETLGILAQHAIQSKMSRVDTALTRFLVYSQVIIYLLSFSI